MGQVQVREVKEVDPARLKKGDVIKIYSTFKIFERKEYFEVVIPAERKVREVFHSLEGKQLDCEEDLLVLRDEQDLPHYSYVIKLGSMVAKYFPNKTLYPGLDRVFKIEIETAD